MISASDEYYPERVTLGPDEVIVITGKIFKTIVVNFFLLKHIFVCSF